ncbi:MAG: CBS domain-containing protein [Sediminibacterium sp.]|nr:CBS domain-containing protein [Sediminibacterium sp.]
MRSIKQIIEGKGPHFNFVEGHSKVIDALTLMKAENTSYLIVLENGKYKGLMSEHDYAQKVILSNRHSDQTTVLDVVSNEIPVVSTDSTPETCLLLMSECKTGYLPVFEAFDFKGVLTINDLLQEVIQDKQSH